MAIPLSFIWKGQNSLDDYGLYIKAFPDRMHPAERHTLVEIPGRPGSLVVLEGEDVYASFKAEMTVLCKNAVMIDRAMAWLRGSGELVLSNDADKARPARIVNEVRFESDGHNCFVGTIPFLFQPFRQSRFPEQTDRKIITGASDTIFNPGDVASRPIVRIEGTENSTVTINGRTMTFTDVPGIILVDCEAEMILEELPTSTEVVVVPYTGVSTGSFWRIPAGQSGIAQTGCTKITIDPCWRWL